MTTQEEKLEFEQWKEKTGYEGRRIYSQPSPFKGNKSSLFVEIKYYSKFQTVSPIVLAWIDRNKNSDGLDQDDKKLLQSIGTILSSPGFKINDKAQPQEEIYKLNIQFALMHIHFEQFKPEVKKHCQEIFTMHKDAVFCEINIS